MAPQLKFCHACHNEFYDAAACPRCGSDFLEDVRTATHLPPQLSPQQSISLCFCVLCLSVLTVVDRHKQRSVGILRRR